MAVYYRYRSGVDTFSLPVAGPSIPVVDLKRLIMGTSRHGHGRMRGRGPREGIAISDAQTGEEYSDDSASVLRNSTVVVRRVAGPPADTIVASPSIQRSKAQQEGDGSSSDSTLRLSASAGTEDDEAKAISAVIDSAELKSEGLSRSSYGHRGAEYNVRPPPAGYVCRRCRVPGHFIQHCPTNGDPRFDFGRCPVLAPAPAVTESNDDGVPADLHCKICKEVMVDAVVASKCCFSSFCDRCIRAHIAANSKCVCGAKASADDLIPNPTLRTTISNILAARASGAPGGGSGTEKQRSSAAVTPQTQSPAAAQESHSSHVSSKKGAASSEHSDGSKSTTAPAAPYKPRKEQDTMDTAGMRSSRADHQYGYDAPFAPACYEPFFSGMQWSAADPSMYFGYGGMPYAYAGGYPMASHPVGAMGNTTVPPPQHKTVPPPQHNGGSFGHGYRGIKRTRADCEDQSFKRRCDGGRSQVALVLT